MPLVKYLTEEQKDTLLRNSVGRVISMTQSLLEELDMTSEVAVNTDDWDTLKPIVLALWDQARQEIYLENREDRHT